MTAAICAASPAPVLAQGIEIAPFGGYSFGFGDFFESITSQPVDQDGAPAVGVVLNVPVSNGFQIEGLFTHQHAQIVVPGRLDQNATLSRASVDNWQAGGLQELGGDRLRPFLTFTLGLTRYAADADSEVRFTVGAGGGMKLFPQRHLGLRLDGRVFVTFIDAEGSVVVCAPGSCLIALHASVVWQAEFTAGLVVKFF